MTQDFVTRLQAQLRDAAEREARGGALAHALRGTGRRMRSPELATALAVAALAIAIAAGVLALRGEEPPPSGPTIVAELELTGNPDLMQPAFGAVWIADPVDGDLVRVDPRSRTVTARVHVGSAQYIEFAPVGDELWVAIEQPARILRVDPETNTVSARVPLRTPDGRPFPALGLMTSDRGVWALSHEGALRLDPETAAGQKLVGVPTADDEPRQFALGDETLWELGTSGTIYRFDAATGARLGQLRPGLEDTQFIVDYDGDLVAVNEAARAARMDGASGRVIWETAADDRINGFDFDRGLIWAHATTAGRRDRLNAYSLADGKRVSSLALDTFGATGLTIVGDEIWINSAGGRTIVARQPTS